MRICSIEGCVANHSGKGLCRKHYNAAYRATHKEEMAAWNAAHKEEKAAYNAAYYAAHKEEIDAYQAAWNAAHKAERAAYWAAYQAAHKEENAAHKAAYYAAHKAERAAWNAAYYAAHKEEKAAYNAAYQAAPEGRAKKNALTARRRTKKLLATPKWLTRQDNKQIQAFYLESVLKSDQTGIPHEVDHIVPLQGKTVSGLHVPWNLQVITMSENCKKNNILELIPRKEKVSKIEISGIIGA